MTDFATLNGELQKGIQQLERALARETKHAGTNQKTYVVKGGFDVCEVDFEDGDGDGDGSNVNWWDAEETITAENPIAAIAMFFDKLNYSFDQTMAHVDGLNGENVLFYSTLVDEENSEVEQTSEAFEEWKAGKRKLYSANAHVEIFELVPVVLPNIN